ncbi:MAG: glycosyltransferase family 4 protein [Bacteroides sp.]|nr:glycosyltransferase family 4 protein [Bacteroides sp.]
MNYTLYIYLLVFLICFFGERLYFRLADKYGIIDKPNERSSHNRVTLRGGGIIFYFAALLYGVVSGFHHPWFLVGLTLIAGISFVDDIRTVPNGVRLIFHFTGMLLMFRQWGLFGDFPWWYIVIALIFCTGIINAFNFMDGINGLTGGYSLCVLVPLLIINRQMGFIDERLLVTTAIGLLVFCLFNFRPKARCFAGDVGAVSIAFIILFAIGRLVLQTGNPWYIMLLAVYGVDSILTILRRLYLRENIFQAHRRHVYQLLSNELKNPQLAISSAYMLIQLGISLTAVYRGVFDWRFSVSVIAVLIILYLTVVFIEKHKRI